MITFYSKLETLTKYHAEKDTEGVLCAIISISNNLPGFNPVQKSMKNANFIIENR